MGRLMGLAVTRAVIPLLLASALVLPYAAGAANAYLQSLLGLIIVIWHAARRKIWQVEAAGALTIAPVAILFILFTITNPPGRTDFLFAGNFAILLLMLPIAGGLSEAGGAGNVLTVARLALAGTVLALGIALYQRYGLHFYRARGVGSTGVQAASAALILSFVPALGFIQLRTFERYFYLLGPLLGLCVVWLAGARGAALMAMPLLAIVLFAGSRRRWLSLTVFALALALAAAVFLLFPEKFGRIASLPLVIWDLLTGRSVPGPSGETRSIILRGSIQAFLRSPWIGHGWGEKTAAVRAVLDNSIQFPSRTSSHLHSDILDFGVAGGLAGLLAYAMILVAPVVAAWRSVRDGQYRSRLAGAFILAAGYGAGGVVNLMLGFEFLTTLYVMLAAILIGYCRDAPPGGQAHA